MSGPNRDAGAVDLLLDLVAIPSVTGEEGPLIDFLDERLGKTGLSVESIEVSTGRRNLFVHAGHPRIVLTTHGDTVPPFFAPRREGGWLHARGACDAKGSLAAQVIALEQLRVETEEVGLLVLVGEERGSDGALAANACAVASEYLIGGEPTGNRFVAGSKGCLRVVIETRGEAGHSSDPRFGRSAIHAMLDLLGEIRSLCFADDPVFGETTVNVGVLEGGRAPNVVADRARAEVLFRTGRPVGTVLAMTESLCRGRAELLVAYRSDPLCFRVPAGNSGEIVSFACDLPLLSRWGQPMLVGPGSIADAHAEREKVELSRVEAAVGIYVQTARRLLVEGEDCLEAPEDRRGPGNGKRETGNERE